MAISDVLRKLKLVESDEAAATPAPPGGGRPRPPSPSPSPAPARPSPSAAARPASETIDDVLRSLPPARVDEKALARAEGDDDPGLPDFPAVYRAAGVEEPKHGYGADRVLQILSSPELAALDARAKAAALAGFLRMNPGGPVAIKDVVQDAIRRDQALDSCEQLLLRKLAARRAEVEERNRALEAEIEELVRRKREAIEKNRGALAVEEERIAAWLERKRAEEARLHQAIAPFVEPNPVTLGGPGGDARGGRGERTE